MRTCRLALAQIDSTVGDIENKVLARARHMREQQKASG